MASNCKVSVDKAKCIGCGMCVSLAPKTFAMDSNGKVKVKTVDCDDKKTISQAAQACPVQAIELED